MKKNIKSIDGEANKTSVFWALLLGKLPSYILDLFIKSAGSWWKLWWKRKEYDFAVKCLVRTRCVLGINQFPEDCDGLRKAIHNSLVEMAAEILVFEKHRFRASTVKAKFYFEDLYDSAKLLGCISGSKGYMPYYTEAKIMVPTVEARLLEEEKNRIM